MSSEWTALSIEKITFLIANAAHRKLSDEKLAQHFNNCFTTEKGQQLMTAGAVNCILASFKFADGYDCFANFSTDAAKIPFVIGLSHCGINHFDIVDIVEQKYPDHRWGQNYLEKVERVYEIDSIVKMFGNYLKKKSALAIGCRQPVPKLVAEAWKLAIQKERNAGPLQDIAKQFGTDTLVYVLTRFDDSFQGAFVKVDTVEAAASLVWNSKFRGSKARR